MLIASGTQARHRTQVIPTQKIVPEPMTKALADIPGNDDPVHRHSAHGFVDVLEDSVNIGVKGGEEQTPLRGQIFHEGPNDVQAVGRNASKTKQTRFVVFLLKD